MKEKYPISYWMKLLLLLVSVEEGNITCFIRLLLRGRERAHHHHHMKRNRESSYSRNKCECPPSYPNFLLLSSSSSLKMCEMKNGKIFIMNCYYCLRIYKYTYIYIYLYTLQCIRQTQRKRTLFPKNSFVI